MKILITGATGFIGRHLTILWHSLGHEIIALARNIDAGLFPYGTVCIPADITDASIKKTIISLRPEVVVHSAAASKPNDCELEKDMCDRINIGGTQHVIQACKAIGAKLVFMSTDFVFGHHGPYQETDAYCPVNYYGKSKVMGEKAVVASGLGYAIVRTVMVYGKPLPGQNNTFLQWVAINLEQEKPIKVFTDQYRSVTYVADLCRGIDAILTNHFQGIVHLCGQEIYTPYTLAQAVADHLGFDKNLIHAATKLSFPEPAIRPENSVLSIAKAKAALGFQPTSLQLALQEIF